MDEATLEAIRYPVGRRRVEPTIDAATRDALIASLAENPLRMRTAVEGLTDAQLDTPLRDGAWTVRQVVHHCADADLNLYVRFKLALTEDGPPVKPFDENLWAETADGRTAPVEASLRLYEGVHGRWHAMHRAMGPADFARVFRHPETGENTLDRLLQEVEWHGRHHAAQVAALRERMGW
jgi:uncharacterized damage-inducible protein DinB